MAHSATSSPPSRRSPLRSGAAAGAVAGALCALLTTCQLGELVDPGQVSTLQVNPVLLVDSAKAGSATPRRTSIALDVIGDAAPWTVRTAHEGAWLRVAVTTGTAPDTIIISLDPAGLAVGVYRDTLLFQISGPAATPVPLPVEFRVSGCGIAEITPGAQVVDSLTAADCGAPHRSGRFARLFRFAAAANESLSVRLTSSAFDAYLVLDSAAQAGAPAFAENDACRSGQADACLRYVLVPRAGNYIAEVTSAQAGATGAFSLSITRPRSPAAPDSIGQFAADLVTVVPVGGAVAQATVALRASLVDPDEDSVRLDAEVIPVGTSFSGTPTAVGAWVASGTRATVTTAGLANNTAYHWQVRTVDRTGRASVWLLYGPGTPDFRVAIPHAPDAPASLAQLRGDGTTPIGTGAITDQAAVLFRGVVSDADAGDLLRLEVEVQPVGTVFTNAPSGSSTPVAGGSQASATISGLADNVSYHWQARVVDQTGLASAWTSFGAPGESLPDFRVAIAPALLAVLTQPVATTAGSAITPAVRVAAQDAQGNTLASFSGTVSVAIGTNPAGGTLSGTVSAAAVAGVATFANLRIDRAGAGYTLALSAGALATTSAAFAVMPGAATALVFTTQPTNTTAGTTIAPAVQVSARDALGNTATGFTDTVRLVITAGTGKVGAHLVGTANVAAAAGIASFPGLSIDSAGTGYTLRASATSATTATSAAFTISSGTISVARSVVTVSSATALSGGTVTLQLRARDAAGNAVSTGGATVAFTASGGTSTGSVGATTDNGNGTYTAVFTGVTAGTATQIGATIGGVAVTSTPLPTVTVTPGGLSMAQSVVTVASPTVAAGGTVTLTLQAKDAAGNNLPAGGATVVFTASGGTSTGTVGATTDHQNGTYSATFSGVLAGTATQIHAAIGGTAVTSTPPTVTVTAGAASRLAFTTEPVTATAGADFGVVVTARDAQGNTATGFAGSVTVALGTNPGGGTLSGTASVSAVAGVAAFTGLSIDRSGTGYTLTASATGPTSATSVAFDIVPSSAGRLSFTAQPANTTAGAAFGVTVTVRDSLGNTATSFTGAVGLAITAGTGKAGAHLLGTPTAAAVAGVAIFSGLSVDSAGTGYTLTASASGPASATSAAFDIAPGAISAVRSVVSVSSGTVASGGSVTLQLQAKDAFGNDLVADGSVVSFTASAGTSTGTIGATTDHADGTYTAVFTGVLAGTATEIGATIGGVAVTSTLPTIVVTAGAVSAAASTVAAAPASIAADGAASTITVTARDGNGNPVGGATVVLAATGMGNLLTQPAGPTDASGVATGTLSSTVPGDKTVSAAIGGVGVTQTASVTVTPGAASQLVFTQQPSGVVAGVAMSPAVTVAVQDVYGNTVTAASGTVTLALTVPGGATLTGGGAATVTNGVATFGALSVDQAGSYTLTPTTTVVGVTTLPASISFAVSTGGASRLALTTQPSASVASGAVFAQQPVLQLRDASGNAVGQAGVVVTTAIASGEGTLGGTLTATTNGSGIAAFADLAITGAIGERTLSFSATGVASATSTPVTVTAGEASQLAFTTQPAGAVAGEAFSVVVAARDAQGNAATVFVGDVTVAITGGTGRAGAHLLGTATIAAVGGTAAFPGLSIDSVGTGYTLTASTAGPISVTSAAFSITLGGVSPSQSALTVSSGTVASGGAVTLTLQAKDAAGNNLATGGATVVFSATGGTSTGAIGTTIDNGNGTYAATFTAVVAGSAATIGATIGGAAVTSVLPTITVTPGAASHLVFTTEPANTTAGSAFVVVVTARDAAENTATGFSGDVGLAITAGTGKPGAVLAPATSVAAVAGIATFGGRHIDGAATGYTLTATSTSLPSVASAAFDVTAGGAAILAKISSGDNLTGPVGTVLGTPHVVQVTDALGNPVSGVAVEWAVPPSSGSVTPASATTDAAGLASAVRTLGDAAGPQTTTATATVGGVPTAVTFDVTATVGGATQLVRIAGDGQADTVGATLAVPLRVRALDALDNAVPGVTISWSVLSGGGSVSSPSSLTDAAGETTMQWTLGTAVTSTDSIGTVRVSGPGTPVTFIATRRPGSVSASVSTVAAAPGTIAASSGSGPATITVTARDGFGNPIPGRGVVLTATPETGNTLTQPAVITNAGGVATGALSSTMAEGKTVSATINGTAITQAAAVAVTPAGISTSQSLVQVSSGTVASGGTVTLTLQAKDAFGNNLTTDGSAVSFSAIGGTSTGTIGLTTDHQDGTYTAVFTGVTAGTATEIGATIGGVSVTTTLPVVQVTAGAATQMALHLGDGQSATVGAAVTTPPSVVVRDVHNNPVSGVSVTFAVASGGGSATGTAATTDASGIATVGSWTLGTTAGANTLTATSGTLTGSPVTFAATATASAATQIALSAGNNQSATVGTAVTTPPSVVVRDVHNNPVSGVSVTFAVASGGGSATGTAATTDASGIATVGSWTLGTTAGANTLTATSGTLTGSPVTFTATGTAGAADHLTLTTEPSAGAVSGSVFAQQPVLQLRDAAGNAVSAAGVEVTAALASGAVTLGGTLMVTTDASGVATFTNLTITGVTGDRTLGFSAAGLTGTTSSTISITAGAADHLTLTTEPSASAASGSVFAQQPVLQLRDAAGNAVGQAGVEVTAALASGAVTLGGTLMVTTNASGVATFTDLAITGVTGDRTLGFSAPSLTGVTSSTVTITAGAADHLTLTTEPSASAASGAVFAQQPVLQLRDAAGNAVSQAGVEVTAALASGAVTLGGTLMVTTDASGVATFTDLAITGVTGDRTLGFSAPSLTGVTSSTVTITAAAADHLTLTTEPSASAASGSAFAQQPVLQLRDAAGNAVSQAGVEVTAALASGAVTLGGTLMVTTNASGVASFTDLVITGAVGDRTLGFSAPSLTGVTSSTVTITAGAATQIAVSAGNNQSAAVGTAVTTPPAVLVRDAENNPVAGVSVTFAVASGGGSATGTVATTDASGIATVGSWTLGTTAGANTLTATSGTLTGSPVTFTATGTAGVATQIALQAGDGQSATVGTAVTTPPAVLVSDAESNPVAGMSVTFAVATGGGSATGTAAMTDASGIATVGSWTLGTTAGANTLTATSGTLTGSPVTFTATGTAGAVSAAQSTVAAAPGSVSADGGGSTITVTARDAQGNPIAGATVVLVATGGGNTLTQPAGPTSASGVATGTLSSTVAEGKSVSATIEGVAVTQTATVTVTAGAVSAALSTVAAPPGPIAPDGSTSTVTVTARDAQGNPIAGATVVLVATGGGNTLTQPAGPTSASGVATGTLSSTVAEEKTVSATIDGVAVTQTAIVTVSAGAISGAQSMLSAAPLSIVADGSTSTITVTARDGYGNPVSGATVVLVVTGSGNSVTQPAVPTDASGGATGSFSSTVAEAKTVSATINGASIAQTAGVSVTAGAASAAQSTATVPAGTAGAVTTVTVQAKDASGNNLTAGGAVVVVAITGANSATPAVTDNLNGTYTASYTPTVAGTDAVAITLGGAAISGSPYSSVVSVGAASAATSTVAVSSGTVVSGDSVTITLQAKDANGNNLTSGGAVVVFSLAGDGSADGTFGVVVDHSDGTYTVVFTGTTVGSANTVNATIDGNAVTWTPRPTIEVTL